MFLWQKWLRWVSLITWEGNISATGEVFQLMSFSSSHLCEHTGNFDILASHKTRNASFENWGTAESNSRVGTASSGVVPPPQGRSSETCSGTLVPSARWALAIPAGWPTPAPGVWPPRHQCSPAASRLMWHFIRELHANCLRVYSYKIRFKRCNWGKPLLSCEVILEVDYFFGGRSKVALQ